MDVDWEGEPAEAGAAQTAITPKLPTTLKELKSLLASGEGAAVEFKRSTGELKEGLQTLCAFLNGSGGMLIFGIRPDGTPEGNRFPTRP